MTSTSMANNSSRMDALSDDEVVYLERSLGSPSVDGAFSDDGDFVLVPHTPITRSNPSLPLSASGATSVPLLEEETGEQDEVTEALAALSLTRIPQPRNPSSESNGQFPTTPTGPRPAPTTPQQEATRQRSGRKASPTSTPTLSTRSPASSSPSSKTSRSSRRARKRREARLAAGSGLGQGVVDDLSDTISVVDDWSDTLSEISCSDDSNAAVSDEALVKAQKYIASYIANPPPVVNNGTLLPLLQALIVELGILAPSTPSSQPGAVIPRTLTAARAMIKARVFIGIREYLAAREDGPQAIAKAMHPSRSALVKALRKGQTKRVGKEWVKKAGLSVLLVNMHW